jgi:hypothetical protein
VGYLVESAQVAGEFIDEIAGVLLKRLGGGVHQFPEYLWFHLLLVDASKEVHEFLERVLALMRREDVSCEFREQLEEVPEGEAILAALGVVDDVQFLPVVLGPLEGLPHFQEEVVHEIHEVVLLHVVVAVFRALRGVADEEV